MVAEVRASEDIAAGRNVIAALDIRLGLNAADGIFIEYPLAYRTAA